MGKGYDYVINLTNKLVLSYRNEVGRKPLIPVICQEWDYDRFAGKTKFIKSKPEIVIVDGIFLE